jgi:translocation and assembly module TamB
VKRSALLPTSFQQQSFSPIRFDLTAQFPSNVYVRNALVDTEVRGNLKILGTPDDPSILGEITTPPGGKIMFRDVPFEISSSNVRFTDPTKLNPTLYAAASTRLQDYDVNFLLQGTRENYRINLRSTPPLPEADIISLLALGYTPQQLERVKSDQQIDQQSYEIGGALLSNNPLGNEIKSKYGINVRFGSAVDDATQTVAPKVIVSKQWTSKFNTSASRTVGNVVKQDVKAEYQLNRNVSVIGSWEGKEFTEEQKSTQQTNKSTDVLGLDLQYRMEFK